MTATLSRNTYGYIMFSLSKSMYTHIRGWRRPSEITPRCCSISHFLWLLFLEFWVVTPLKTFMSLPTIPVNGEYQKSEEHEKGFIVLVCLFCLSCEILMQCQIEMSTRLLVGLYLAAFENALAAFWFVLDSICEHCLKKSCFFNTCNNSWKFGSVVRLLAELLRDSGSKERTNYTCSKFCLCHVVIFF